MYIATPDRIVRPIKIGEITNTEQTIDVRYNIYIRIGENNGRLVTGLSFTYPATYRIRRFERSEFTWLRPPLAPGKTWRVFNIGLRGRNNIEGFSHVLEALSVISAQISDHWQTVATPTSRFEDCLEIQYYETLSVESTELRIDGLDGIPEEFEKARALLDAKIHETAATEFRKLMPNIRLGTLWLAPGVGPVKIKEASGTSELVAYDVKKDSDQWQVASGR